MEVPEGYILITLEEYNGLKEEMRVLSEKLAKLSKTSVNSSNPPSSDVVKQRHKNDNEPKGKIGGQPGHPKHERNPFSQDDVHNVLEYSLSEYPGWRSFATSA